MKNLTDAIQKLRQDAERLNRVSHDNAKQVARLKKIIKEDRKEIIKHE